MELTCKSCLKKGDQNFSHCPYCGEKKIVERLTIKRLILDFFHLFTNIQGPVLSTLKTLTINPYSVTNGYIIGQRKKYIPPMRYVLIALTISGLFFLLFKNGLSEYYEKAFQRGVEIGSDSESNIPKIAFFENFQAIMKEYQKHINLIGYLTIPIFSLFSFLLLNKNVRYNFAEHLVVNSYIFSHNTLITSLLGVIAYYSFGQDLDIWINFSAVVPLILLIWFMSKSLLTPFWKSALVLILSYLCFVIVVAIVVLIIAFMI